MHVELHVPRQMMGVRALVPRRVRAATRLRVVALALIAAVSGCTAEILPSQVALRDAAALGPDADGLDVATATTADTGPRLDAALDAGRDAGDAAPDTGVAALDADVDAATDAAPDTGALPDAAPDAAADGGTIPDGAG